MVVAVMKYDIMRFVKDKFSSLYQGPNYTNYPRINLYVSLINLLRLSKNIKPGSRMTISKFQKKVKDDNKFSELDFRKVAFIIGSSVRKIFDQNFIQMHFHFNIVPGDT